MRNWLLIAFLGVLLSCSGSSDDSAAKRPAADASGAAKEASAPAGGKAARGEAADTSAVTAAAKAAPAALTMRIRTTSASGPPIDSGIYWLGKKRVTDQDKRRFIYDLDAKTVTVIDKSNQAYTVRTFDEITQQRDVLNKRFEGLPLSEREKIGLDKPMTLKATGKSESVAGRGAKEYKLESGPITGSVWLGEVNPPAGWESEDIVVANAESSGYAGRRLAEEIAKLDGLPVRMAVTMNMGTRQVEFSSEVIEIVEQAPPPELLAIPEGYRKVDAAPAS